MKKFALVVAVALFAVAPALIACDMDKHGSAHADGKSCATADAAKSCPMKGKESSKSDVELTGKLTVGGFGDFTFGAKYSILDEKKNAPVSLVAGVNVKFDTAGGANNPGTKTTDVRARPRDRLHVVAPDRRALGADDVWLLLRRLWPARAVGS